jgi:hypothetical protein
MFFVAADIGELFGQRLGIFQAVPDIIDGLFGWVACVLPHPMVSPPEYFVVPSSHPQMWLSSARESVDKEQRHRLISISPAPDGGMQQAFDADLVVRG